MKNQKIKIIQKKNKEENVSSSEEEKRNKKMKKNKIENPHILQNTIVKKIFQIL